MILDANKNTAKTTLKEFMKKKKLLSQDSMLRRSFQQAITVRLNMFLEFPIEFKISF